LKATEWDACQFGRLSKWIIIGPTDPDGVSFPGVTRPSFSSITDQVAETLRDGIRQGRWSWTPSTLMAQKGCPDHRYGRQQQGAGGGFEESYHQNGGMNKVEGWMRIEPNPYFQHCS